MTMRKRSKHTTAKILSNYKESQQELKKKRNKGTTKQWERNEQNGNSNSLLINNYSKYKCLNSPSDVEWLTKKARPNYMLHRSDSNKISGHSLAESEGMGKGIPWKWKLKERAEAAILTWYKWTLPPKLEQETKRSLYNNKGVNSWKGCTSCKYMCI